jgi:hypothetical protein
LYSGGSGVAFGAVGCVVCSLIVGASFLSIQLVLFSLNLAVLAVSPFFYLFVGSIVGLAGSFRFVYKKLFVGNSEVSSLESSSPIKPQVSSEKEKVGFSGVPLTLLPGTKIQNGAGSITEFKEPIICWPVMDKSVDAPEEPKSIKKTVRRFFERVED